MKTKLQAIDPAINTENTGAADPFDLDNLRLSQSFTETASVRKLLKTVPVHKPNPQDFVRVHPSPDYRMSAPVIELKDEREEYIVIKFDDHGEKKFVLTIVLPNLKKSDRVPPAEKRRASKKKAAPAAATK